MDLLLPQIKERLASNLDWVRSLDVCLIPHAGVIQDGAGFPYIGIKDGNVTDHELMGEVLEQELPVEIYIYDRLDRSGDNILGLHVKVRQIRNLLRNHDFSGDIASVEPKNEPAVALLYTRNGLVIRKGLHFKYERQEG